MARVSRRRTIRLIACAGILGLLDGVLPVASVSAASDKLPDLRIARVTDFTIQRTSSGRRLLRFSGMMINVGNGPLEVRARRASTKKPWIVDQVVYRTGGGTRRIRTTATMKYAGDGHDHWHVRQMMSYHLWSTRGTVRDAKIGFCFFDTNRRNTALPGAPRSRKYGQGGCGKRGSLHTKNGISVGWADLYPRSFAFQWIDVTGVPAGTYIVRGAIDLYGKFRESSETNNCTWSRISFKATGSKVKVLATGTECLNDHDSTPFAADIDWALAERITTDCDADMFCTYDTVNRGQLAWYLAHAMHLPATDTDFFTDDAGSTRETDINRAAAAGLFPGCTPTTFCPSTKVTRSLMAVVIAKALALAPTGNDYFTDDTATSAEPSINEVAEAGVMDGCTATRFCPTARIKRGETMRILHRAILALEPPPAEGAVQGADPSSTANGAIALAGVRTASMTLVAAARPTDGDVDATDWVAGTDESTVEIEALGVAPGMVTCTIARPDSPVADSS